MAVHALQLCTAGIGVHALQLCTPGGAPAAAAAPRTCQLPVPRSRPSLTSPASICPSGPAPPCRFTPRSPPWAPPPACTRASTRTRPSTWRPRATTPQVASPPTCAPSRCTCRQTGARQPSAAPAAQQVRARFCCTCRSAGARRFLSVPASPPRAHSFLLCLPPSLFQIAHTYNPLQGLPPIVCPAVPCGMAVGHTRAPFLERLCALAASTECCAHVLTHAHTTRQALFHLPCWMQRTCMDMHAHAPLHAGKHCAFRPQPQPTRSCTPHCVQADAVLCGPQRA